MTLFQWISRSIATLRERSDGAAAVEFAVAAPVLVGLLVPLVDLGMGLHQQTEVKTAAQAGAEYALLHAPNFDSTAIAGAVTNATGLAGLSASPAPAQSCGCPTGSGITAASCGSTCSSGQTAGTYVTVNAQAQYTPLLSYVALSGTVTLSGQSVVRIK